MEREVGGGIGMGKTCKLKDVSFQCMTKFTIKKKKKRTKPSQLVLALYSKDMARKENWKKKQPVSLMNIGAKVHNKTLVNEVQP